MFRAMHGRPASSLRRTGQLWKVSFTGEEGRDAGGPYRESWTLMSQEMMSPCLPLLKPSPNGKFTTGFNRDAYVLNPDATSTDQIQMFEFLGKLMGMAARSSHYMDLMINPMAWKAIVGGRVTLED